MAITVNIQEAKTQLSRLLKMVDVGEEVVIANRGLPVAKIISYDRPSKRQLGFVKGTLPESFFEPLNEEELEAWGL